MAFQPRHAIHVVRKTDAYDVLICFHCGDLKVYDLARPDDDEHGRYVHLSRSTQAAFDDVLRAAGVPLASE